MPISLEVVASYYDSHQRQYTRFWSEDALHYGFWYATTRTLTDALANTNRFVLDILDINADDVVLDAGCGVAGTAIFIAQTTGARVEGITLSQIQLAIARTKIAAAGVSAMVHVSLQDFQRTSFPDATFTKQFSIESICHANDKRDYLSEAYRLMKPGGRLAIVDAFLADRDLSSAELRIYANAIDGWAVPNLLRRSEFESALAVAGFVGIKFYDMQAYVWPSIRRIYRYGLITTPVNLVRHKLGLTRRNVSALFQKALFERRIATYGVFVAERPCGPPGLSYKF
jgi:cyclopropane fatty-acyl-phospholipid synthase-like methyltransferase